MGRIAGRNARIYMGLASSTAVAEPVAYQSSYSINFSTNKMDVTAFGDTNKQYLAGLPDAAGDFAGFYDDASVQTYTAATDGQPRRFYLYPNTSTNTQYFFGTILADMSVNADVDGPTQVSASWAAATPIIKQG